ncbi:hypothetical protein TS65_30485 [Aneurinibacillus migulanus]|uniref:Uncharacterized protein n=1 Tax=Aneurinibacillus migulanus TaxID=47500 RepID=A0A0D1VV96_ANEMI|nr:hypothetical protein TS65_30485 [Aneurinibacillus migulanus]KON96193.1 hypothetical protein AF333_12570 [Aneurinibacillus migulanus]SDI74814.1 hypothetical protein SAMN04487909_10787 [Aneurinibacillus migulanus]
MQSYFKGAGASLFVVRLVLLFISKLQILLLLLFLSLNYLGCTFGALLYCLINQFFNKNIIHYAINTFLFGLLGYLFGKKVIVFFDLSNIYIAITILGSVIFYWSQFIKNYKVFSFLAIWVPVVCIFLLFLQF